MCSQASKGRRILSVVLPSAHWDVLVLSCLGPLQALEIRSALAQAQSLHFPPVDLFPCLHVVSKKLEWTGSIISIFAVLCLKTIY